METKKKHDIDLAREDEELGEPIKRLPRHELHALQEINKIRMEASLKPLVIRVRRCLACHRLFESTGERTCGCVSRATPRYCGREVL